MPVIKKNYLNRIIDANINRAKEGLRVCEEIMRFVLQDRNLTQGLKRTRQRISLISKKLMDTERLLQDRNSQADIGKNIYVGELKRLDIKDIFYANIQRAKESLRVLEEFSKLKDIRLAVKFKNLRYYVYEIEKKATRKISALRNFR